MSIFVGSDYEYQSLTNLSKLVDDCQKYGIPVMAVTAVGKELEKENGQVPGFVLPHRGRIRSNHCQDLLVRGL